MTKQTDKEFATEVANLVREVRKVDDVRKMMVASAYVFRERNGKLTDYLEAADESWDDASGLITHISLKELGF